MRWIAEFREGTISTPDTRVFDHRLLDYRIDVLRLMERKLHEFERIILNGVHVDGMSTREAVRRAAALGGQFERLAHMEPDMVVAKVEAKMGRIVEQTGMSNILSYLR